MISVGDPIAKAADRGSDVMLDEELEPFDVVVTIQAQDFDGLSAALGLTLRHEPDSIDEVDELDVLARIIETGIQQQRLLRPRRIRF